MEYKYTGYLIPASSMPFPDQIILTDYTVIHKRYQIIGVTKKYFLKQHISSVYLDKGILFCTIIIRAYNDSIAGHGFTNRQGEEIKRKLGY